MGRVFLYTPSRAAHGPWPCICLHSLAATTPDLALPPDVRRAFDASSLEDKVILLYFPVPDPVRCVGRPGTTLSRKGTRTTLHHSPLSLLLLRAAELWQADRVGGGVGAAAH